MGRTSSVPRELKNDVPNANKILAVLVSAIVFVVGVGFLRKRLRTLTAREEGERLIQFYDNPPEAKMDQDIFVDTWKEPEGKS